MRRSHGHFVQQGRLTQSRVREALIVGLLLVVALALRCALASLGWPAVESDEATMGLMADDILWHGAHPIFFYGQHYLGAFQAYLAALIFAVLGPTNLALHVATALETLLFLVILYLLTRVVFSRAVALWTLLLLALGPFEGLFLEEHAGAGAQETLVFGAALLALTYMRLSVDIGEREQGMADDGAPGWRSWRVAVLLDVGLGATAGLGLWAHLLTIPFIATVILALGGRHLWRALRPRTTTPRAAPVAMDARHLTLSSDVMSARLAAVASTPPPTAPQKATARSRGRSLANEITSALRQAALFALGFLLAAFPFIQANIASRGATFSETFDIAGAGAAGHGGLLGHALALGEQLTATLLIGLPHLLNATLLCPDCVMWPRPHAVVSIGAVAHEALIALPLSLGVIALWCVNALALAPARWHAVLRLPVPLELGQPGRREIAASRLDDPTWWGRALYVTASALILLEYIFSRASYATPGTSARYLIGLYVCTPLVVAPLVHWSQPLSRRLMSRSHADEEPFTPIASGIGHARLSGALLSAALLICMVALNLAGAIRTLSLAQDRTLYHVPTTASDTQVIDFLLSHHATRFYTTYWVCNRLMFDAAERLTCAVIDDQHAFQAGFNRIPATQAALATTAHPAYVFFSGDGHAAPSLPGQVRDAIASRDPRFVGYTSANVAGYQIFYYSETAR